MAELTLLSTGLLRSSCVVVHEGHDLGRIEPASWSNRARVMVEGEPYDLRRDHRWRGSFRLRQGDPTGPEVAWAEGSVYRRHFEITLGEAATGGAVVECGVVGRQRLSEWAVEVDGHEVGSIRALTGVRLRGHASLPDGFGAVGQIFCCALVTVAAGRSRPPSVLEFGGRVDESPEQS